MYDFKKIYGGQEFLTHFKYSEFLTVTYISMLYGLGMPVLFPIASLYFLITYICERIQLVYFMKCPPQMGDDLTKQALDLISLSPLILLFFGWWMIGNKQIFENKWTFIDQLGQPMPSGHRLDPFKINYASPMFLMAVCGIFIHLV